MNGWPLLIGGGVLYLLLRQKPKAATHPQGDGTSIFPNSIDPTVPLDNSAIEGGIMATQTKLPAVLNDGTYTYSLVRQGTIAPDGTPAESALYERMPPDFSSQFTPDLRFVLGLNTTPIMIPIARGG